MIDPAIQQSIDAHYEAMPFVSIAKVAADCARGGIPLNECGPSSGPARVAFEAAYNTIVKEES